jgi:hypothetical protein
MRGVTILIFVMACAGDHPGELRAFDGDDGGLVSCGDQRWCSFAATLDGDALALVSRSGFAEVHATLTADGRGALDALVADVPASTPADQNTCEDGPVRSISIAFGDAAPSTFRYDCEPGPLAALDDFLDQLRGALEACQSTADATVDACDVP